MTKPTLMLTLALALTACAQPAPHIAPASVVPAATVSMVASLDIRDTADRQVLAVLEPWKKADIDHVELSLYKGADATAGHTLTIAQADLSKTIRVNDLAMNSDYRIEARAFADASGTVRIDDLDADASSCTTVFSTTVDELVNVGVIKLSLQDKTFDGTGTSSGAIDVTDGELVDPTASTTLELI